MGERRGKTSRDVAEALGIAQSTVSRAFTPGAPVSDALRARVHEAAARIGYRPNLLARGLIAGRSHLVGMVIAPETNLLYPELLYELGRALAAEGRQLLLFPAEDAAAAARAVERLQAYRVDAVLATGVLAPDDARALAIAGVRLVTFNRLVAGVQGVSCDFAGSAAAMTAELRGEERRRFALIRGAADSWVGDEFERGARAALADGGVALAVVAAAYAYGSAAGALADARAALNGWPDAILCVNDVVAAGCLDRLEASGRRVPEAVAIATMTRHPPLGRPLAALRGRRQPLPAMTAAAVDMLLGRWTGNERLVVPALPIAAPDDGADTHAA